MKRLLVACILLLLYVLQFVGAIVSASASEPTPIDRDITFNTVLTRSGSPYIITRNITVSAYVRVEPGVKLIIAPGVHVYFRDAVLDAEGSTLNHILIINKGSMEFNHSIVKLVNVDIKGGFVVRGGVFNTSISMVNVSIDGGFVVSGGMYSIASSVVRLQNVNVSGVFRVESWGENATSIAVYNSSLLFDRVSVQGAIVFHSAITPAALGIRGRGPALVGAPVKLLGGGGINFSAMPSIMYAVYGSNLTLRGVRCEFLNFTVSLVNGSSGAAVAASTITVDNLVARAVGFRGPDAVVASRVVIRGINVDELDVRGFGNRGGRDSGRGLFNAELYIIRSSVKRVVVIGESVNDNWVHEDWGLYGPAALLSINGSKLEGLVISGEKGGVAGAARVLVYRNSFKGSECVYIRSVASATALVYDNCFSCTKYGLRVDEGYVYAGHNWWGSPEGPNAVGSSRVVVGRNAQVDYGDWLTRRPKWCIFGIPPVAKIVYSPLRPEWGENVTFVGTFSYDIDGYIVKYIWDFGDGSRAYGEVVRHVYDRPGNYTVRLTVVDNTGLEGSAKVVVHVTRRKARLMVEGAAAPSGGIASIEARLVDAKTGSPLVLKPVVLKINGILVGRYQTDENGMVTAYVNTSIVGSGNHKVVVEFPGDEYYLPVSASAVLVVVPYRIRLVDYSVEPANITPGGQGVLHLKVALSGGASARVTFEFMLLGKRYNVEETLYPGLNDVKIPVVVPRDAVAGSYPLVVRVKVAGMLYASWQLSDAVHVAPVKSASIESVNVLGGAAVGSSMRVSVRVRNTGNVVERLVVRILVPEVAFAESSPIVVAPGQQADVVLALRIPENVKPGLYNMKVSVVSGNVTLAETVYTLNIEKMIPVPELKRTSIEMVRRGLVVNLVLYNDEKTSTPLLARVAVVKGKGNCVNIPSCIVYDYAKVIMVPAKGTYNMSLQVNLDSLQLNPLDVLELHLILYTVDGKRMLADYRLGRVPVIELLRKMVGVAAPKLLIAPLNSSATAKIVLSSSFKIENVTVKTKNPSPDALAISVVPLRVNLMPGEEAPLWVNVRPLKALPGMTYTAYVILAVENETLLAVPVRVHVPSINFSVHIISSDNDDILLGVDIVNTDTMELSNCVASVSINGGLVIAARPGKSTLSTALLRIDRLEPGEVLRQQIVVKPSGQKITYTAKLECIVPQSGVNASVPVLLRKGALETTVKGAAAPGTATKPPTATNTTQLSSPTSVPGAGTAAAPPSRTTAGGFLQRNRIYIVAGLVTVAAIAAALYIRQVRQRRGSGETAGTGNVYLVW